MKTEAKVDAPYIESVLHRYGFEQVKRTANGYSALCKFHDDKSPSFSIGNNGLWCCFACGEKGNLRQLHQRLGGETGWQEEIKMMGAQLDTGRYSANTSRKKPSVFPRDFRQYSIANRPPAYVLGRLTWGTVGNFKLGSSNDGMNRDRCIIPIYHKGKAVGFHGRAVKEGVEPRYWNSPGFDIKEYLFNYDGCERGKEVIVVEGAFNAMSMWEKGFRNVVATFGTKFTPKQVQLIFSLSPESIVVCFDRDSNPARPGQKAAVELANITYQLIPTYIMPLPFDKDPNDLQAEALVICHQKRVAYDKLRK